MRPDDFWRLHPVEFWWLVEANRAPKTFGKMTEAEVAEMYEDAYGSS